MGGPVQATSLGWRALSRGKCAALCASPGPVARDLLLAAAAAALPLDGGLGEPGTMLSRLRDDLPALLLWDAAPDVESRQGERDRPHSACHQSAEARHGPHPSHVPDVLLVLRPGSLLVGSIFLAALGLRLSVFPPVRPFRLRLLRLLRLSRPRARLRALLALRLLSFLGLLRFFGERAGLGLLLLRPLLLLRLIGLGRAHAHGERLIGDGAGLGQTHAVLMRLRRRPCSRDRRRACDRGRDNRWFSREGRRNRASRLHARARNRSRFDDHGRGCTRDGDLPHRGLLDDHELAR